MVPVAAIAETLLPGLLVTEFPRLSNQVDAAHVEVSMDQFVDPIGVPFVATSVSPWHHKTERNAIASGFLQIDADGDYAFTSASFNDRNLLLIDGQILCGYGDGVDRVETVFLEKGLVEITSVGFVLGRGASGIDIRWRPPDQREFSTIPPAKLSHKPPRLLANWIIVTAKDFVINAYKNGERIPKEKRRLLLDRFGASVERIDIKVHRGDWLAFQVANNQIRHGGAKFFAVAGCLETNEFGFVSDPNSEAWTVCNESNGVKQFIAVPDSTMFQESTIGIERPALEITNPWNEGMGFMRQYAGKDFHGKPLWGKEASTWIKFVAPGQNARKFEKYEPEIAPSKQDTESSRPEIEPEPNIPPKIAVQNPKKWPVQIISAIYGTGGKNADVTAKVKQYVEIERKMFAANPVHLGADPNPYWNKGLHIVYYKDGVRREQHRNENEHILPESFYGPQDQAELTRWLVGTRWHGPKGEVQFQENGLLTGQGVKRGVSWRALAANRLKLIWSEQESVEFHFDYVWSSFRDPNDGKNAFQIVTGY